MRKRTWHRMAGCTRPTPLMGTGDMRLPPETCGRPLAYTSRDASEGRRRPMALMSNGRGASTARGAIDIRRRDLLALAALGVVGGAPGAATAAGAAEGQLIWAVHV